MVRRALDRAPTPSFAAACLEQTDGYPLYLGELLHVLQERDTDPDNGAAGEIENLNAESLARHVWRRVESVNEQAGTVIELLGS